MDGGERERERERERLVVSSEVIDTVLPSTGSPSVAGCTSSPGNTVQNRAAGERRGNMLHILHTSREKCRGGQPQVVVCSYLVRGAFADPES